MGRAASRTPGRCNASGTAPRFTCVQKQLCDDAEEALGKVLVDEPDWAAFMHVVEIELTA